MSQYRIRRIGWGVIAVAVVVLCGGVLWQFSFAQHNLLQPSIAETVSEDAKRVEKKSVPPPSKPAVRTSGLESEEILIIGTPFRLVLPHRWLEQPLVVRAKPGSEVTFMALDSGKFSNDQVSITITADGQGFAQTTFYVNDEGDYRVLASSRENSGRAVFTFQCVSAERRSDILSGRFAEQYRARKRAAAEGRQNAAAELEERIKRQRSVKQ